MSPGWEEGITLHALTLELCRCGPCSEAWRLGAVPGALEPGTAALIHAKKAPRFALSIYILFMKKEKQGPRCLSNQKHHGLLSLQWEDGQVSLWGTPLAVCVS